MNQIRLNATSIAEFKACPRKFQLKQVERIVPEYEADTLRIGTNWHKMHEVYAQVFDASLGEEGSEWTECEEAAMDAVLAHLNNRYTTCPPRKTALEWAVERQILLQSFCVYQAYYAESELKTIATEQKFEIPLMNPLRLPVHPSLAVVTGRMDRVVETSPTSAAVFERKSTSQAIEDDAEYWQLLRKNEQVTIYSLAFRSLIVHPYVQGNTLYDVWRKPQIEPKMLTQGDTATLIADKTYLGETFEVETSVRDGEIIGIFINGEATTTIEPGKKGFAIRETSEMYGARLRQLLCENPARHFVRKEIARTDAEIEAFEVELYAVYTAMRCFAKEQCFFENPHACKSPYPCEYLGLCYGPGAANVIKSGEIPAGFTRLTNRGQVV